MRMRRALGFIIGVALVATSLVAQPPAIGPDGGLIYLPASADSSANQPLVAGWRDGEFVVGWWDGILRAQRFSAAREPIGPVMELGGVAGENCGTADLEADDGEGFWATWCVFGDGLARVQLQRFERDGSPATPVIDVHPARAGWVSVGAGLAWSGGTAAVLWTEIDFEGPDYELPRLRARVFDDLGFPLGPATVVSDLPPSVPNRVAITPSWTSGFIATWTGLPEETELLGASTPVRARRLDGLAAPLGKVITVVDSDVGPLAYPKIALVSQQRFVVAWSASVARYRLFDEQGGPLGPEQDLGQGCLRAEYVESVASDGTLLGALLGCNTDASLLKHALLTDAGLGELADVAPTHAYRAGANLVADGRFIAAWLALSNPPGEGASEIRAQRFKYASIFGDDFESGGTDLWSVVVP